MTLSYFPLKCNDNCFKLDEVNYDSRKQITCIGIIMLIISRMKTHDNGLIHNTNQNYRNNHSGNTNYVTKNTNA